MFRPPFLLSVLALLAGCGGTEKSATGSVPEDAAVSDALAAPLMTDPDLVSLNDAHAAIAASGPISSALPPIDRSQDAIAAARAAAGRLVGGAAPLPETAERNLGRLREAVTAAQMAVAAEVTSAGCAAGVRYTARWAAALPEPLQIYPRGAVEEAAGSDADGCRLRVVHYRTPVPVAEVVAFHHARLRATGWPTQLDADGDDHALRGRKGGTAYVIYVRKASDELTIADIVVGG